MLFASLPAKICKMPQCQAARVSVAEQIASFPIDSRERVEKEPIKGGCTIITWRGVGKPERGHRGTSRRERGG